MTGEFTLNSPLTKEDWDKITDVELEHTKKIWFATPSGKRVEYIPMSVIDNIRAEIQKKYAGCSICEWFEDYDYEENNISEYQYVGSIDDILEIIDEYIGKEKK